MKALITGGSHGIGLAIAKRLAQANHDIVICSRTQQRLEMARQEIGQYNDGRVTTIVCDAADAQQVKAMLNTLGSEMPTILINNVGGGGRWGKARVEDTDWKVWQEVYQKNAGAAIQCTMACLPAMLQSQWGRVVTIASKFGKEAGGRPWFTMAKAAEIALMKSLAKISYLSRANITFNTVAPGNIMIPDTGWETLQQQDPEAFQRLQQESPRGRFGTPEEVASLVAYLCTPEAALINGACLSADGGESVSF